tara:strand:- start:144 stop:344 length:201 start_codon:yes stop_codon:yes gene_type:complete
VILSYENRFDVFAEEKNEIESSKHYGDEHRFAEEKDKGHNDGNPKKLSVQGIIFPKENHWNYSQTK